MQVSHKKVYIAKAATILASVKAWNSSLKEIHYNNSPKAIAIPIIALTINFESYAIITGYENSIQSSSDKNHINYPFSFANITNNAVWSFNRNTTFPRKGISWFYKYLNNHHTEIKPPQIIRWEKKTKNRTPS